MKKLSRGFLFGISLSFLIFISLASAAGNETETVVIDYTNNVVGAVDTSNTVQKIFLDAGLSPEPNFLAKRNPALRPRLSWDAVGRILSIKWGFIKANDTVRTEITFQGEPDIYVNESEVTGETVSGPKITKFGPIGLDDVGIFINYVLLEKLDPIEGPPGFQKVKLTGFKFTLAGNKIYFKSQERELEKERLIATVPSRVFDAAKGLRIVEFNIPGDIPLGKYDLTLENSNTNRSFNTRVFEVLPGGGGGAGGGGGGPQPGGNNNALLVQCNDGLDNDGDSFTDFPNDPDCQDLSDNSESNSLTGNNNPPACHDGIDNDGDGFVDFTADADCVSVYDNSEFPGISGPTPGAPQCANGFDDDGDGFADFPADPGCVSASDNDEFLDGFQSQPSTQCNDLFDNDGDNFVDYPNDSGCSSINDNQEFTAESTPPNTPPQCLDGIDNDNDTLTDFPNDLGCASVYDNDESGGIGSPGTPGTPSTPGTPGIPGGRGGGGYGNGQPQCANGFDDDGDGLTDFPTDTDCASASDDSEGFGLLSNLFNTIQNVFNNLNNAIANNPGGAAATGLAGLGALGLGANAVATSANLANGLWRLFSLPLLVRKRRAAPWGVVYNSITRRPVEDAIVSLFESSSQRLKTAQHTDKDGRFGFVPQSGVYYLTVAKNGFRPLKTDLIPVKESEAPLNIEVNVAPETSPLRDPHPFQKTLKAILRFIQHLNPWILIIGTLATLVIAYFSPILWNYIVLGIYIATDTLYIVLSLMTQKSFGQVFNKMDHHPLDLAVVRLFDAKRNYLLNTQVTPVGGKFKMLMVPGEYYITCSRVGYQPYTSDIAKVSKDTVVSWDIELSQGNSV